MFNSLFAAHKPRPSVSDRSFRPCLEALEDRLAPAPIGGQPPSPSPSPVNSSPLGPGIPTTISSGVPGFQGVFPTTSIGPFGLFPGSFALVALDGGPLGFSQNVSQASGGNNASSSGAANQLGQLQQLAANLYQLAAQQNVAQANALVIDEFFRAADTFVYLNGQTMGINNPNLLTDITAHENAISQNPLDQTLVGQLLGPVVFDATLTLFTSGQAS